MEEKLKFQSLHDSLTGLFNRTYFEEKLNRLQGYLLEQVGIVVCDLDGLKSVNDTTVGFPKFKSKHHNRKSYTTNNQKGSIRLIDSKTIRLPKLKDVRVKMHRQLPPNVIIKSATISQTPTGKNYISILVETPTVENAIGLDYSSKALFVDSETNSPGLPEILPPSRS